MTIFYGARDLLDITEGVPSRRHSRNWRRILAGCAIFVGIVALAVAALMATP